MLSFCIQESIAAAIDTISREYGGKVTFYICSASEGARPLGGCTFFWQSPRSQSFNARSFTKQACFIEQRKPENPGECELRKASV